MIGRGETVFGLHMIFRLYLPIILIIVSLLLPSSVLGLMTSTNYIIFADDFNSGLVFTSSTYRLEGTAGESPVGGTSSSTYQILAGYQAMDRDQLSLTISNNSLGLGDLSTTQVRTATTDLSVTTDADEGYVLSITNVGWSGAALNGVSDGSVSVGFEEYGFSIVGNEVNLSLLNQDNAVINRVLASTSTAITASTSTLTFKAAIRDSTSFGQRTQTIALTLSINF